MKRTQGYFRWPVIIVCMLLTHVLIMMVAVTLATRPSAGAAVIPDYYQKAVHWDQTRENRTSTPSPGTPGEGGGEGRTTGNTSN